MLSLDSALSSRFLSREVKQGTDEEDYVIEHVGTVIPSIYLYMYS